MFLDLCFKYFLVNLGYNEEDKSLIINAISEIKSLEEIEYLTKSLQAGEIPNKKQKGYTETLYEGKYT